MKKANEIYKMINIKNNLNKVISLTLTLTLTFTLNGLISDEMK